MDSHPLQKSFWHQTQKLLLPESKYEGIRNHHPQLQDKNSRSFDEGFFEIEMLIWISIILLILVGHFSIHKAYKTEHQLVQEEFTNEWNKLKSKRRN